MVFVTSAWSEAHFIQSVNQAVHLYLVQRGTFIIAQRTGAFVDKTADLTETGRISAVLLRRH